MIGAYLISVSSWRRPKSERPVPVIAFPAVLGLILLLVRRQVILVSALATLASLLLALLAWFLPDREQLTLGPWTFPFENSLTLLGRTFTRTQEIRRWR
jgi:hypothetical protein